MQNLLKTMCFAAHPRLGRRLQISAKSRALEQDADKKMKQQMTHPLFKGIDEDNSNKVHVLTEQLDLLEAEVARRIRDLTWA